MCGIVGVLGGEEHINRVAINEMSYALRHRGPDSDGIWKDISSEIFLGHRRLSILDVSSRGNQPMISKSGRYIICLLYTSPSPRDRQKSRMPSSA